MAKESKSEFLSEDDFLVDNYESSDIMRKRPFRTAEELPAPISTYETQIVNQNGDVQTVTVKVYPPEPSPLENMKPAFAFSTQH